MDKNVQDGVSDKYSLRGQVFHQIRDNILKGIYKENEELKEMKVAQELGVSRTPVREALRQLELEGLVHVVPNKGAYVTGITSKDVKDIYVIRSLLEGLCARMATSSITKEQMDELEENIYLAEFNVKKDRTEQVYELDGEFHETLYQASGSRILQHVLTDFHSYVQRVRKSTVASHERAVSSIEEHTKILEAIKAKDGNKAEQLANNHMMQVMEYMKENGIDGKA